MAAEAEPLRLAALLNEAAHGPAWSGPSLREALDGCTATEAAHRALPEAHTVWELVLHTTGWAETVRRRLAGEDLLDPPEGDWPAPAVRSEAGWARDQAALLAAYDALADAVRGLPPSDLARVLMPGHDAPSIGGGVTAYRMLHGAVAHAFYHAGQIVLLRRAHQARPA